MIRKLFVLAVVLCLFSSCEKKPQTPQELLLGNWVEVKKKPKSGPISMEDTLAYEFKLNNICDYKSGYLDYDTYMNDTLPVWERVVPYLGTETKYRLANNSLKIFNLSNKTWDQYKVKRISADSLLLNNEDSDILFIKKEYSPKNSPDFNTIVLSTGGCMGPCPGSNIIIDNDGNVLYNGYSHVKNKGHFTGKISKDDFNELFFKFKQVDYINLKSEYPLKYPHGSSTSLTFIKNGKILKSINDEGTAPKEFEWAYKSLLYKEQELKLTPVKIKPYLIMEYNRLSFPEYPIHLEGSEVSYLVSRFQLGKEVNKNFDEKYELYYCNKLVKKVITDGRFYKFYLKDGKTHIIDIGFNFLKANTNNKELE